MFKKLNKKGFTLAELLVVVAIIGVLVAISIPIFTAQLEKARDAVTLANLRSAYAQAQTAYLTGSDSGADVKFTAKTASDPAQVVVKNVESKGTVEGLDSIDQMKWIPSTDLATLKGKESLGGKAQNWDITFKYNDSGEITSVTAGAHSTN